MNRKYLVFVLSIFYGHALFSQNKSIGFWKGTMDRDDSRMEVSFEFKIQKGVLTGYYNSPAQKASGIPLDSIVVYHDTIFFQLMSEPVTFFKCKANSDSISGSFIQKGFADGIVTLKKSQPPVRNFAVADTSFKSGDSRIACRIYIPYGTVKCPGVIFMHGSGAEGMFANQFFAEHLASKGIITLIQDKRGVGRSTGKWQTSSFETLASDHINAIQFLKTFKRVNPKQIGIYGHSQGGTIAPLVASRSGDIAFVIAAEGVGDTVYKQDLYRTANNLKSNGFSPEDVMEAINYYKLWLDIARKGTGYDKIDSLSQAAKNRKWSDWVEIPPKDHWIWKYYLNIGNFNSLEYWKMISVPVLLVYGEDDQIEDIRNYIQNIDRVLIDHAHNGDVTQVILPKAQHNLCVSPGKNEPFFWWYISPGYPDLIASWILYRFKN